VLMSAGVAANVTAHGESFIVLMVQSGVLAASASATITLTGLTMGDATADVVDSVSIITSKVRTCCVRQSSNMHIALHLTRCCRT
jgi:hypothetical protein